MDKFVKMLEPGSREWVEQRQWEADLNARLLQQHKFEKEAAEAAASAAIHKL